MVLSTTSPAILLAKQPYFSSGNGFSLVYPVVELDDIHVQRVKVRDHSQARKSQASVPTAGTRSHVRAASLVAWVREVLWSRGVEWTRQAASGSHWATSTTHQRPAHLADRSIRLPFAESQMMSGLGYPLEARRSSARDRDPSIRSSQVYLRLSGGIKPY